MNVFGLGLPELLIVLVILLLLFGKDRLPDLARSIGRAAKEIRGGFTDKADDTDTDEKVGKKK